MARLADLSLKNRLFMATYRYRRLDPVPFTPLPKPLPECRLALITTGALHLPEQTPFDAEARGGDVSYRAIPLATDVQTLGIAHSSDAFDQAGLWTDRNLGFPLDRLKEMSAAGEVGPLNGRHLSFMGSITAPGRLIHETAPEAARKLVADGVEAALLVPL
jgi:D-proline reductase (dithiol) PrdB